MESLHRVIYYLEIAVAAVLVILALTATAALVWDFIDVVRTDPLIGPEPLLRLLDAVLVIFIIIELFNIALAYIQRREVIPTVMEAALVAVARKLVVLEAGDMTLEKSAALALLVASVGVTWWLLRRAGACTAGPVEAHAFKD